MDKTVPLSVTLKQETLEKMTGHIKDVQPVDVLSRLASRIFETMASGGMVLTPDQVAEIEHNYKKPVSNGRDVVLATESQAKRFEGGMAVNFRVDPTWEEPLKALAEASGRTIDALFSDMWEIAFQNQWVYALTASTPPIYLKDYSLVQKMTGLERPTGPEIEKGIRELMKRKSPTKKLEEPEVEEVPA